MTSLLNLDGTSNQASDENREYLIDRTLGAQVPDAGPDGISGTSDDTFSAAIVGQIDVGDSLRGHVNFNKLNSAGANLGGLTGNNELSGVFQALVTQKTGVGGGQFVYSLAPDPAFEAIWGAGAMMVLFEDATPDFAGDFDDGPAHGSTGQAPPADTDTNLANGPFDDGTPGPGRTVPPSSADVSVGPFQTEEAFIQTALDGTRFVTLGFTAGDNNGDNITDPAPGEGMVLSTQFFTGDNVLNAFSFGSGTILGTANYGLNRIVNATPETLDGFAFVPSVSPFGAPGADLVGSTDLRGVQDLDTAFDLSTNTNVTFKLLAAPEVDAKITIEPDDTNEVGDDHTFTVTVMEDDGLPAGAPGGDAFDGFGPAAGETVTITLDGINGAVPDISDPSDELPADPSVIVVVTDASGMATVTFTSASAGQVIGTATSSVNVGGTTVDVETDGLGNNSGPATKTFVDAKIIIEPDDTNEVGDNHTFVATVFVDDGLGTDLDGVMGTFDAVGAGEDVTITLNSINGATAVPAGPFVGVTDASGQFSATFTSNDAGQVIGSAMTTLTVVGPDGTPVMLSRQTDGSAVGGGESNSGPATKTFVDAKIIIEPDDTNEVGDNHTFVATVFVDDGLGTDLDGVMGTFDAVGAGVDVKISLNSINGATAVPGGPFVGTTDAAGQFNATFTSNDAGQVFGTASTSVDVTGPDGTTVTLVRQTDGSAVGGGESNSGPATKTFVDAKITIGDDDTNLVGQPHSFTTTGWVDDGLGTDVDGEMGTFDRVGGGVGVSVTLDGVNGAIPDLIAPMDLAPADPTVVAGTTDGSGEFDVTFTSATTGEVIGTASVTLMVTGPDGTIVTLTRTTDGSAVGGNQFNSGPAEKIFLQADIEIDKKVLDPETGEFTDAELVFPAGTPITFGYFITNPGDIRQRHVTGIGDEIPDHVRIFHHESR